MRFLFMIICCVLTFSAPLSQAMARCQVAGYSYRFQNETVDFAASVDAGTSCDHTRRAFGRTVFTGFSIVQRPSHGTLARTGDYSVRYTPKAGFRGKDTYAIRICGRSGGGSGCSTIRYLTTVQ